jgi:hypothetical protein
MNCVVRVHPHFPFSLPTDESPLTIRILLAMFP